MRDELRSMNKLLLTIYNKYEEINSTNNINKINVTNEETKKKHKSITCKICKEQFDNHGLFMSHMKKHKREG